MQDYFPIHSCEHTLKDIFPELKTYVSLSTNTVAMQYIFQDRLKVPFPRLQISPNSVMINSLGKVVSFF